MILMHIILENNIGEMRYQKDILIWYQKNDNTRMIFSNNIDHAHINVNSKYIKIIASNNVVIGMMASIY